MAQVARVHGEAAGDPLALKSLSVQFRGLGVPEKEITITSKPREDGVFDHRGRPGRQQAREARPSSS